MNHHTMQVKVKNGEQNVFVSLLQNKILLSIYALNGSMNISLDQGQVEKLIEALEQTQAKVQQVHESIR